MKKIFLFIVLFFLISLAFIPASTNAGGLVPCGNEGEPTCSIGCFFQMLVNIYDFIVKMIATPLAVLALTIGGILILISAGNPNLMGKGKTIFYAAIIGLALVWCSYLIIDFVMHTIGYKGNWASISGDCSNWGGDNGGGADF